MKILLVHNEYREPGGEEKVVDAEIRLLREQGFQVQECRFRSRDIAGIGQKIKTAIDLPYSSDSEKKILSEIARFKPDILHVHNFFPLATPSVFFAAKSLGVKTVFTLHNFRILCANGLLLRENKPCELCVSNGPTPAVIHGCYQGSRLASLAVARMIRRYQGAQRWEDFVDQFIVLTNFAKSIYLRAGIPENKISIKPNFIFHPAGEFNPQLQTRSTRKVVFVGRLSGEKGISTLLKAKKPTDNYQLNILGDGELGDVVKSAAARDKNIVWHGRVSSKEVYAAISDADLLVFPSECYENFPISILEAMAHGRPVVASRIGGIPEIVQDGETGFLFEPGNEHSLSETIQGALGNLEKLRRMGLSARLEFEQKYSPAPNFSQLNAIYEKTLKNL